MVDPLKLDNIFAAVGHTPLVRLQKVVSAGAADVYVKIESGNPTGSYKDRMALAIIEEAEKRGELRPGMTVVECTGGSTGTSLAFVCAVKGYPFRVVSSDAFAKEKLQTMRLFGATLEIVKSEGGRITPDLIPAMIKRTEEIAADPNVYLTRQFQNHDALVGYHSMGGEIVQQLPSPPTVFCAAVGTAGMLMGVSAALRRSFEAIRVIALEPAEAPLISLGIKGSHNVDGIGVGFVPPLLDKNAYHAVRTAPEQAARTMARRLAAEEGIFAGTSSGLNVAAAVQLAEELGKGHTIVTVACDTGMKYLSGTLYS